MFALLTCVIFNGLAMLERLFCGNVFNTFDQFVLKCFKFDQVVCQLLSLDQFGLFYPETEHIVVVGRSGC